MTLCIFNSIFNVAAIQITNILKKHLCRLETNAISKGIQFLITLENQRKCR